MADRGGVMSRRYGEHSCPLPKPQQNQEGFIYACSCGRLWVPREDWHHAGGRLTEWRSFEPARRRLWQ